MNALSIIIPSKTLTNLEACVSEISQLDPLCKTIVVDDFDGPRATSFRYSVSWVKGVKPFIFSRNVNLGIKAAGRDDVLILNDDALLKTYRGFTHLQEAAEANPQYGLIAAVTNNVGRRNQFPRSPAMLREDDRMVCFVAVLIPRRTIDAVGLLDEDFNAYGFEDDDYCYRVRKAGLKIGIDDRCFVDHKSLPSTFRAPGMDASLKGGREIFIEKHGAYPL